MFLDIQKFDIIPKCIKLFKKSARKRWNVTKNPKKFQFATKGDGFLVFNFVTKPQWKATKCTPL
jgi:hypothetical protein